MHYSNITSVFFVLLLHYTLTVIAVPAPAADCTCGYHVSNSSSHYYTNRMFHNFATYPDVKDMLKDAAASDFRSTWFINGWHRTTEAPQLFLDQQYEPENVQIVDGSLILTQKGYSEQDLKDRKPVRVAGLQSKTTNVLHGSFRVVMKHEGDTGGAVSSFFWYSSDTAEIDIESITPGTSFVNDTINYTTHPSTFPNGTAFPNATLRIHNMDKELERYHEHRFDCDAQDGVTYYMDGKVVHKDSHSIPKTGGSVQLSLWANNNQWWGGRPSTTDVRMMVKQIEVYYNVTDNSPESRDWSKACLGRGDVVAENRICRV